VAEWKGKHAVVELFLGRGSLEATVKAIFTPTDRCETAFYLVNGISFEANATRRGRACRRRPPRHAGRTVRTVSPPSSSSNEWDRKRFRSQSIALAGARWAKVIQSADICAS